jgi:uncharacterized membrane protein YraQ (UPF0718 family)
VTNIPLSAWEQGFIVVLFAVLVVVMVGLLLGWFSKQQKATQDYFDKKDTQWQTLIKNQAADWQNFIREERKAASDVREQDLEKVSQLTGAITGLHQLIEKRLDEMMVAVNGGRKNGEDRRHPPKKSEDWES